MRTLKERNYANETLVLRVTLPLGHDDGIVGLHYGMLRVGIKQDDFRQVAVQIR